MLEFDESPCFMSSLFNQYQTDGFFDEMFTTEHHARPHYAPLIERFQAMGLTTLQQKQALADACFMEQGVTFTVYGQNQSSSRLTDLIAFSGSSGIAGTSESSETLATPLIPVSSESSSLENAATERIFPFDLLPRIIPSAEWEHIELGLKQRVMALNLFLQDVYHEQKLWKNRAGSKIGRIPKDLILSCKHFRPEFQGVKVARQIYIHICGTDLIRDEKGQYWVLEDNVRCPSGISYVLKNREILKRVCPQFFTAYAVRSVDAYPQELLNVLQYIAPYAAQESERSQISSAPPHANAVKMLKTLTSSKIAILTPGRYNSAYFEHSFLAQAMGIDLVEASDLVVKDTYLYKKTTQGLQRIDVLYRRIDDEYLDPCCFRKDSVLGVAGLVEAYRAGHLSLANGIGTGVADDKAIYAYVPEMIRFYLGEEPLLPNVETYLLENPKDLQYVLEHLEELVIKSTNASGGYGLLIGPQASKQQIDTFRQAVKADPRGYIAQPVMALSRVPVWNSSEAGDRAIAGEFQGRHVDLRPYVLYGENITIVPGGLTRVAMRPHSLVVNSSQGGGSKDTWVLA